MRLSDEAVAMLFNRVMLAVSIAVYSPIILLVFEKVLSLIWLLDAGSIVMLNAEGMLVVGIFIFIYKL